MDTAEREYIYVWTIFIFSDFTRFRKLLTIVSDFLGDRVKIMPTLSEWDGLLILYSSSVLPSSPSSFLVIPQNSPVIGNVIHTRILKISSSFRSSSICLWRTYIFKKKTSKRRPRRIIFCMTGGVHWLSEQNIVLPKYE